jgi:hypothetical protein
MFKVGDKVVRTKPGPNKIKVDGKVEVVTGVSASGVWFSTGDQGLTCNSLYWAKVNKFKGNK